ncbi:SAM-dependent methyltransferase [Streptomyces iconiensis]|uniref:Class I SAM-dependent methyltransferase n=1 Tax=Streptomyces iconiensis TaxID=1384038 RepID=A0ABT6ZR30_9ACTN|nr:class I SAM-dependent methyltransferase [Streptomyces iconiensis]MDJ1131491.1 class I SAM-dependent methyltransferase [Streptomyces iconiensis]
MNDHVAADQATEPHATEPHATAHDAAAHGAEPHTAEEAARFWEKRYSDQAGPGKGRPNPLLADTAASLTPGTALDLGCGAGGDTVYLAGKGWRVTATDIAANALARTARQAAEAGVAHRVTTERHDLGVSFPAGEFDLVSAQYFHTPYALPRARVLRQAAHALTRGGLLLIVDHGSVLPWSWNRDPDTHFPSPQDIYESLGLDPAGWTPERLERPQREAVGPGGQTATATDTVIAVRRHA